VNVSAPNVRVAITTAPTYNDICSTLPEDAPLWPVHHRNGKNASSTSKRPSSTV